MIAARIPQFQRQSHSVQFSSTHYAEANFCIALRVWDVLLWFAIMQRPRRDVGICTDFASTLAEYSIQLLPRSIFPYDTVPMTRVDAVDRAHVFMDTQYHEDKYGGRIFRPAVIPRHVNQHIGTPNFELQCPGRIAARVLEDEAYMSNLIATADHMGVRWNMFPVHCCQTLAVHWEYGMCYPMTRYVHPPIARPGSSDENGGDMHSMNSDDGCFFAHAADVMERLRSFVHAVLYLHPGRHSMMLFAVDPMLGESGEGQRQKQERVAGGRCETICMDGGDAWSPRIELVQEFSLLPILDHVACGDAAGMLGRAPMMHGIRVEKGSGGALEAWGAAIEGGRDGENSASGWGGLTLGCTSVQDMQNRIFKLGFGPTPYFRRPGVLLYISPEEEDDDDASTYKLGCIVPHRFGVHGCCTPSDQDTPSDAAMDRCYFCHNNPFFEVLFYNPACPYDGFVTGEGAAAMEMGTSASQWMTMPATPARASFRVLPVGTRLLMSISVLAHVIPLLDASKQSHIRKEVCARVLERQRMARATRKSASRNGEKSQSSSEDVDIGVAEFPVRCFLNTTSVQNCMHGLVCVAISCANSDARNAGREIRNLYVAPQHLALPEDDRAWDQAASYIYI
jgi:hypothetical protein